MPVLHVSYVANVKDGGIVEGLLGHEALETGLNSKTCTMDHRSASVAVFHSTLAHFVMLTGNDDDEVDKSNGFIVPPLRDVYIRVSPGQKIKAMLANIEPRDDGDAEPTTLPEEVGE